MKYSKAKIKECAEWVEKNGLYPQKCGAHVKTFCEAMGIGFDTYQDWMMKPEFSESIKKASEVFAQKTKVDVVNALVKSATGFTTSETKLTETGVYDPDTKKLITKKAVRVTTDVTYPPNVVAGIFLVTNLDPDNWKNKQVTDNNIRTEDGGLMIQFVKSNDEAGD